MKHAWSLILLAVMGCGSPEPAPVTDVPAAASGMRWPGFTSIERLDIPVVEDNVHSDTLLIQVTFALPDGSFLMVAGPQQESREGLHLYRYTLLADSSARVLAVSPPAFDSYTMLPTFFGTPGSANGPWVLLANFGEKDSWGQKVLVLDDTGFQDLGFIDAAVPELRQEADTSYYRLTNLALHTNIRASGDSLLFRFSTDSLHLYDDLRGQRDRHRAGQDIGYVATKDGGFFLRDKGELHRVAPPA
jgi:hypothetical protein